MEKQERAVPPAEQVIRALLRKPVNPLPRGELFVSPNLLDRLFPDEKGDPPRQLERILRELELSLIGVDLEDERTEGFLSSRGFVGLEGYFLVGTLNGPVSRLINRRGFLKGMIDIAQKSLSFSQASSQFLDGVARAVDQVSSAPIRAIAIADDIAGSQGLFFSPKDFKEALRPLYEKAVKIIKGAGLFAFFHSDGDIRKIIELLIEDGFDCLHPVDAQAGQNLDAWAKSFGHRVSFMGHIDIVAWSRERIAEEVDRSEKLFRHGGLILGSSCGLSIHTVSDRLDALYPGWKRLASPVEERT